MKSSFVTQLSRHLEKAWYFFNLNRMKAIHQVRAFINLISKSDMTNSLFSISPYWLGQTWVFDAPEVGLFAEPFVSGADQILTSLALAQLNLPAQNGSKFQLIFSNQGFPDYHCHFKRQEPEFDGYWYLSDAGQRGWLCPATLCFFPAGHPEELYIQLRSL